MRPNDLLSDVLKQKNLLEEELQRRDDKIKELTYRYQCSSAEIHDYEHHGESRRHDMPADKKHLPWSTEDSLSLKGGNHD